MQFKQMQWLTLFTFIQMMQKRWLTPEEVYHQYGIGIYSQAKYRTKTNKSLMPFSKPSSRVVLYDRFLMNRWLEDHQVQGKTRADYV